MCLAGIAIAETIKGTQDAGIIACAKHFIGNEQEHFRQVGEANGFGKYIYCPLFGCVWDWHVENANGALPVNSPYLTTQNFPY